MCTGELQTNNQQLAVRKTEIAAELDLKSNSYVEQVVSESNLAPLPQLLLLLVLSLSYYYCYCYCSHPSVVRKRKGAGEATRRPRQDSSWDRGDDDRAQPWAGYFDAACDVNGTIDDDDRHLKTDVDVFASEWHCVRSAPKKWNDKNWLFRWHCTCHLRNEKKESNIQVALYNQALTPEMRRITDKAQGRWGKGRLPKKNGII